MPDMDTPQKLAVSIREAATLLSVSPRLVRHYIRLKTLQARKIGRRTVIPMRSLQIFLRSDHGSPNQTHQEDSRP